jgi:aspartyl-tRNA(Asn)/glutamyl-tRNA(Gln) amidotransferase subunit C
MVGDRQQKSKTPRSSIKNKQGKRIVTFTTMKLNLDTTKKIADLAKLEFNEEELYSIQKDLEQMISFVEKLKEIDTTGVEPLTHILDEGNKLREDEIQGSVDTETALLNAPNREGNFFTVPKVIKK